MFDSETEKMLKISKGQSKVRDCLMGLNEKDRLSKFVTVVKKRKDMFGAITNKELGLEKESDFKKLARADEMAIREVFSLSSIGRMFASEKIMMKLGIKPGSDAQNGRNLLIKFDVLKKVGEKEIQPYSESMLVHFVNGRCPSWSPRFLPSIKTVIRDALVKLKGDSVKKEKVAPAEEKNWVLKKKGKKNILMSDARYKAYVANKEAGLVEQLDWEDLPVSPFGGEKSGFVGKDKK